jgi:hypothetical protein
MINVKDWKDFFSYQGRAIDIMIIGFYILLTFLLFQSNLNIISGFERYPI